MSAIPITKNNPTLTTELDLRMDKGLPAMEVDRRLVSLARTQRRIESVLCFYLKEVEGRQLYLYYGYASTVDYARERHGFEDRKTRSLLRMAYKFEELPRMKEAFHNGELPWTKAREAVKVATPETEEMWLDKCRKMTNRQLEEEVRQTLPPVRKKTLVFVLEGDRLDAERLEGLQLPKRRSSIRVVVGPQHELGPARVAAIELAVAVGVELLQRREAVASVRA